MNRQAARPRTPNGSATIHKPDQFEKQANYGRGKGFDKNKTSMHSNISDIFQA
jgi:hypothetical protein